MASARTDIAKTIYQRLASQGVLQQSHWRIERQSSNDGPWRSSVTFQLRMTYSALEFYVSEWRRLQGQYCDRNLTMDLPFEGLRLVFVDGELSVTVDGLTVGPRSASNAKAGGRSSNEILLTSLNEPCYRG